MSPEFIRWAEVQTESMRAAMKPHAMAGNAGYLAAWFIPAISGRPVARIELAHESCPPVPGAVALRFPVAGAGMSTRIGFVPYGAWHRGILDACYSLPLWHREHAA